MDEANANEMKDLFDGMDHAKLVETAVSLWLDCERFRAELDRQNGTIR